MKIKSYKAKFNHIKNKHYTETDIEKLADEMLQWFKQKNNVWLGNFAISKNISRQRISEFANKNEYFEYIYSLCKAIQESKLFELGLSKGNNIALVIFALKNNCGWKDKQEMEHSFNEAEAKQKIEDMFLK